MNISIGSVLSYICAYTGKKIIEVLDTVLEDGTYHMESGATYDAGFVTSVMVDELNLLKETVLAFSFTEIREEKVLRRAAKQKLIEYGYRVECGFLKAAN